VLSPLFTNDIHRDFTAGRRKHRSFTAKIAKIAENITKVVAFLSHRIIAASHRIIAPSQPRRRNDIAHEGIAVDGQGAAESAPVADRPMYHSAAESTAQRLREPLDRRNNRNMHSGRWKVKLDPPVNRVLPVGRRCVSALWERLGQ